VRRIIDIHTHVFPDALAERAVKQLTGRSGETAHINGTATALEESMRKNGITLSMTQSVSTKPAQTPAVNGFAIELNSRPTLINFGTLYPGYDGNAAEIQRLKKAGIKGVKFHPDYQSFFVDEERMFPLYRQMADAKLIAFFHAGVDIGLPPPVHCTPDRLARVLDHVPDLTVVAAHFGGFKMWDDVEKYLIGRSLWLDTSFTLAWFPAERFVKMARKHGIERIVFGTDSPWADQGEEIRLHEESGLTESELAAVFYDNAAKLLGIRKNAER
jgi:predicted TIM-barrel fold metal-dependent hydrolase